LGLVFVSNGECRAVLMHGLRGRKLNRVGEATRNKVEMAGMEERIYKKEERVRCMQSAMYEYTRISGQVVLSKQRSLFRFCSSFTSLRYLCSPAPFHTAESFKKSLVWDILRDVLNVRRPAWLLNVLVKFIKSRIQDMESDSQFQNPRD
jgi:hypothetical protein